jgi:uncharacterized pyridoxamine 5'-phosphate oxidase family protein
MQCEVQLISGEKVGTFSFELVPRADEMFRVKDKLFKVAYIEHQIVDDSKQSAIVVVWKYS